MAKSRKSKLVAVKQGKATRKESPRNATRISEDATDKSLSFEVQTITQNSPNGSVDFIEEAASTYTLGSFAASHSPGASISRSKFGLSQMSVFSTRKKQSKRIRRKIRRLNKEPSIIQIYKLKKKPIETQPKPIDDAQNSLDDSQNSLEDAQISPKSKEVEEEQLASGATSVLSFVQLEPDFDADMKERYNLLNNLRNIPDWDGLSATTIISQPLAEEDSRTDVFRDTTDATSSIFQLQEEASLQMEEDYDLFSVEELKNSSKRDSEPHITHISSELELESSDEADNWKVERPKVAVAQTPDITQLFCASSKISFVDEQTKLLFSQTIRSYLYELVDKVMERSETAENQLRKRLDKKKLHKQLCALVKDDVTEREKNDYLNGRLTVHYQHRFRNSLIKEDSSSSSNEMSYSRYQSALNKLDSLLKREQEAERIYITERERLQAELAEKQSQDEQEINRLEDLIWETLLPHTQLPERLELVISTFLRQMRNKRNKLSETRLNLINKQHLSSYILQKLEEKNIIADGLTVHAFEANLEEVNKLDSRLTTKNVELQRMYDMFSSKVHTISHLRCRRKLLGRTFRVAKDQLCELGKKLSVLRVKVHQGHMIRNRLLAQIQDVRYKGGLMNYPLLLKDFDKTSNLVRDKRERVSLLRGQHDGLLGKIEEVELAVQRLQEHSISDK